MDRRRRGRHEGSEGATARALERAIAMLKSGDLAEAGRWCRAALEHHPAHPEALHLLGVMALRQGEAGRAVELITRAVEARPNFAPYRNNLGVALRGAGRNAEAIFQLMRALSLAPDDRVAGDSLVAVLAATKPVREAGRGRLVLGIGTGRCGSTSLARLLQRQSEAMVTHERPPRLPWAPDPTRLALHVRCFEVMLVRYRLVGDVAHWWLRYLDPLIEAFPRLRIVAVRRDRESTTASFERIKGSGANAINHWTNHGGRGWRRNPWDECYPSYELADRREAIGRYWDEYYAAVEGWRKRRPERVMLARAERLDSEARQRELLAFLGIDDPVCAPGERHNVGTIADSEWRWA